MYVILGDRMDFAKILQNIKNGESVKTLTPRVLLDSLRTVCQVFGTFYLTSRPNIFETFKCW